MANVMGPTGGLQFFVNGLFPALTGVLPLLFYVKSMRIFTGSEDWALWSGFIFMLNEQFLSFDATFSYESIGIVFFAAVFYLLARKLSSRGALLASLLVVAMTLSHFWTNFNLVLFLAIFYLLPVLVSRYYRNHSNLRADYRVFQPTLSQLLAATCLFLGFTVFLSAIYLSIYVPSILLVLSQLVAPGTTLRPGTEFRSGSDLMLIIIGQAVLVLFAAHGFLRRNENPPLFSRLVFLVGGFYLVTILFGLPAAFSRPVLHRGYYFGFFAIAPVVAWTVHNSSRCRTRQLKALLLIFTMISVVLIQEPWYRYPDFVAPSSLTYAGNWAQQAVPFDSPFAAVRSISDTFGAYGRMHDLSQGEPFSNQTFLLTSIIQPNACRLLRSRNAHYIAFSSSTNSWLFSYFIGKYVAMPNQQYISVALSSFNRAHFNRVYNAGYVSFYYGC
jgi:hypothetical protein